MALILRIALEIVTKSWETINSANFFPNNNANDSLQLAEMLGCLHRPRPGNAAGIADMIVEACLPRSFFPLSSIGDRAEHLDGFDPGWISVGLDRRVSERLKPTECGMARVPEAGRRRDERAEERIWWRRPLSSVTPCC